MQGIIYLIGIAFFVLMIPVYSGVCKARHEELDHSYYTVTFLASVMWPLLIACLVVYMLYRLIEEAARRAALKASRLPKALAEEFPFAPRMAHRTHNGYCDCSECEVDKYLKLKPKP